MKNFLKTSLKFGLIGGLVAGVLFYTSFAFLGSDPKTMAISEITGYAIMILSLFSIFVGIRELRTQNNGLISFGQAFGAGMVITVVSALLFATFTVMFLEYISPDMMDKVMEYYEMQIRESGQPAEVIEAQLAEFRLQAEQYQGSGFQGLVMGGTVFFFGLIMSLIFSLILRKSKPQDQ